MQIMERRDGLLLHTRTTTRHIDPEPSSAINAPILMVVWGIVMTAAAAMFGMAWVMWNVAKVAMAFFGRL